MHADRLTTSAVIKIIDASTSDIGEHGNIDKQFRLGVKNKK